LDNNKLNTIIICTFLSTACLVCYLTYGT